MVKDLVTVIIPCYNGEVFLDKCFECLLNQDYDKVQLIVVNDGSTDKSEEKILKYKDDIENKGWKFIYIYQENAGAAAAICSGLKVTNGEFLMLYDVDDILYDNNISTKVDAFSEDDEIGVVIDNGFFVWQRTGDRTPFIQDKEYIEKNGCFNALIYEHAYNWPGCYMVRTEMLFRQLEKKDIFISRYGQNLQILLPVAYFYKTKLLEVPLMDYLVRESSVSHTKDLDKQLRLQKGFSLNRIEVVKRMKIPENEKEEILRNIEIWNAKKCFIFAFKHGLKDELKKEKIYLKDLKEWSLKDEVRYFVGRRKKLKKVYDKLYDIKANRYRYD